ncbi:MAG: dienelactone hydrolase family protein [Myxococcales bacterium]|nr:dienelactone hydrolase family protein [Myxococcales bacterium]
MPLVTTTIGSLECRVLDLAAPSAPELLVVLCHGFGAPSDDLVPIGAEIARHRPALAPKLRFLFPAAPLSLSELGLGGARAWWHIDIERMAARFGDPRAVRELKREVPEGLPRARRLLMGLLEEVTNRSRLPMSRVLLGGFSQGGMLATDVALRVDEAPAALAIFSVTLLSEEAWSRCAPRRRGLKVLQSHGRQDPLLPFESAEALRELLASAGLEVEFHPFEGGHALPPYGIARLADLISCAIQRP